MPINLSDSRDFAAMTEAEADKLFNDYARLVLRETAIAAKADQDAAKIHQEAGAKIKPLREDAEAIKLKIERYITAHPERFASPRYRKTVLGRYGMQSVAGRFNIDDETVLDWAVRNRRHDLYVVTRKLIVAAIKDEVAKGAEIPGVTQQPAGERINISINQNAVDAVEQEARA